MLSRCDGIPERDAQMDGQTDSRTDKQNIIAISISRQCAAYGTPKRTEQNLIVRSGKSEAGVTNNKCIGDDTKVAARQSPNCIKNKK